MKALAALSVELGLTQKQLYEEFTMDFLNLVIETLIDKQHGS